MGKVSIRSARGSAGAGLNAAGDRDDTHAGPGYSHARRCGGRRGRTRAKWRTSARGRELVEAGQSGPASAGERAGLIEGTEVSERAKRRAREHVHKVKPLGAHPAEDARGRGRRSRVGSKGGRSTGCWRYYKEHGKRRRKQERGDEGRGRTCSCSIPLALPLLLKERLDVLLGDARTRVGVRAEESLEAVAVQGASQSAGGRQAAAAGT